MVSIITINYNGWQDTCELLASLKQFEDYPHEVIVVDNASHGDDAEKIAAAHPTAIVVRSDVNLGFAGGNNLGYAHAKGNYILFLNNDMVVKAPFLRPLVQRLADSRIGGVSPSIYFFYKPEEIQYFGYTDMTSITIRHTTPPFNPNRKDQYMVSRQTDVMHGGAMMVRRDVIEQVGKMTEIYFLFYEEFDWSLRIRGAGYTLYYEPASRVYHKESMSIPRATPSREYYLTRSRIIYARRNSKGLKKYLSCSYLLFVVLPQKLFLFARSKRVDLMKAYFKGMCEGLCKNISTKMQL